jgi:8-amino-7-oxononanoate synthase
MRPFDTELCTRLAGLKEQNLYRELRRVDSPQGPRITVAGEELLNFSSNDYLGLANEPAIKQAAATAVSRHGAGSGGSRLLGGSLAIYHQLEESLAQFKGAEAALTFSTGYAAAVGTVCALVEKDDIVILDKLSHACLVDAARLSGACLRVFRHNDLENLESILQWAAQRRGTSAAGNRKPAALVITESVFSMDGDHASLRGLVELKERYGAWLMVDEAHATGLYGNCGRGLAEALGVADQIEIQMGTLGKALGASGGYICGSNTLIQYLVNRARTFLFSTAPVPAAAAAAMAAIELLRGQLGSERRQRLWARAAELASATGPRPIERQTAIVPVIVGDESQALQVADALLAEGIYIPAVRYPTVPRGSARLRVTLSAAHTRQDVERLAGALNRLHLAPSRLEPRSPGLLKPGPSHAPAGQA